MLPAGLAAKAMQLCAAGVGAHASPAPLYAIAVHTGAVLRRQPQTEADAKATVRDLIALGADFEARPLAIRGSDFATYGVTPASVFDACALAHVEGDSESPSAALEPATISSVTALLRRALGARITDTIRPMNASYGARYSWHKFGQAVDFVPAGGVGAIDREQVRSLMRANGVRLLELLGPGDPGHSTHWHIAFARPGQVIDRIRPIEGDEDWVVTVASTDGTRGTEGTQLTEVAITPTSVGPAGAKAPPAWDVFAAAEFRAAHGSGS